VWFQDHFPSLLGSMSGNNRHTASRSKEESLASWSWVLQPASSPLCGLCMAWPLAGSGRNGAGGPAEGGPLPVAGLLGASLLCLRGHEAAARVQVAAGRGPVVAGAPDLLEKAEAIVGACESAASRGRV